MVSELRCPRPYDGLLAWIAGVPAEHLFVSAVTMGEIQAGIEMTRGQDGTKAEDLEAWLDRFIASYCVLPMDASAFRRWGGSSPAVRGHLERRHDSGDSDRP